MASTGHRTRTEPATADREVVISRVIDAPREQTLTNLAAYVAEVAKERTAAQERTAR